MKKRKLVGLLAMACVLTSGLALASCGSEGKKTEKEPTQIEQVYAQYVVYAESDGQEPLSYEEWLAVIKGEKGEQGEKGKQGEKGEDGRGIAKVEIIDGYLWVTYTDSETPVNVGKVQVETTEKEEEGTAGLHYQRILGKEEYRVIGIGLAEESDIVIPSTYNGLPVTEIGINAFKEQVYLTGVSIPDSVTSIALNAFYDCDSLTSVVIGDSVTSIGEGAFSMCSSLARVEIPNSVTSIGQGAFAGCSSLARVEIPNSVTSIGAFAFSGCSSLVSVNMPNSVTLFGEAVFMDCPWLTYVEIPGSVGSIGNETFFGCTNLTSIVIPYSVTFIGTDAVAGCVSLTSVYYNGTESDWTRIAIRSQGNEYLTSATRYYYSESEPTADGNYWRYVDGVPTVWTKE